MKNKLQKPRSATESGMFPKPDLSMFAPHESPEPADLPEADDPGSITGTLPIIPEGEDSGKQHDDSAAGKKR